MDSTSAPSRALLGLGGIKLKSRVVASFIDIDIQSYIDSLSSSSAAVLNAETASSSSYSFEQIMRCIGMILTIISIYIDHNNFIVDTLKLYKPLSSECDLLHM